MMNLVQKILDGFSSPILYASMAWFGFVGFFVYACVVMLLTRLSFQQIVEPLLQIHVRALVVSFLCSPVLSVLLGVKVYFLFAILMLSYATMSLCSIFVQATCFKWRQSFFIAYVMLVLMGIFVFKGLGLLQ